MKNENTGYRDKNGNEIYSADTILCKMRHKDENSYAIIHKSDIIMLSFGTWTCGGIPLYSWDVLEVIESAPREEDIPIDEYLHLVEDVEKMIERFGYPSVQTVVDEIHKIHCQPIQPLESNSGHWNYTTDEYYPPYQDYTLESYTKVKNEWEEYNNPLEWPKSNYSNVPVLSGLLSWDEGHAYNPNIDRDYIGDGDPIEEKYNVTDLHSTMDAHVWAEEMFNAFDNMKVNVPGFKRDMTEFFYLWMCNAIMCGYDHQSWKRDKQYIYILQGNSGSIVKIFHYEPTERDMDREYQLYLGYEYCTADPYKLDGIASQNCTLYKWSRHHGLMTWDGKAEESLYNWKVA